MRPIRGFAVILLIAVSLTYLIVSHNLLLHSAIKLIEETSTSEEATFHGTLFFTSGYNRSVSIDTENVSTNATYWIEIYGGVEENRTFVVDEGIPTPPEVYAYIANGSINCSVAFSFTIENYTSQFLLYGYNLYIGKQGTPTGNLTISLRNATDDNKPGSEIISVTYSADTFSSTPDWIWLNATDSGDPISLVEGTYFIVISATGEMDENNTFLLKLSPDPDNPSGEGAYQSDDSTLYILNYTSYDDLFNASKWPSTDIYDPFFRFNGTFIPKNHLAAVMFNLTEDFYIDYVALQLARNGSATDIKFAVEIVNGTDVPGNTTFARYNLTFSDVPSDLRWVLLDFEDTYLPAGTYFLLIYPLNNTLDSKLLWRANGDPGIPDLPDDIKDSENRTITRFFNESFDDIYNGSKWAYIEDKFDLWAKIFVYNTSTSFSPIKIENITKVKVFEDSDVGESYAKIQNYSDFFKAYAAQISITGGPIYVHSFSVWLKRVGSVPLDATFIIELRNSTEESLPSEDVIARWFISPIDVGLSQWYTLDKSREENSTEVIILEEGIYFLVFFTNGTYDASNYIGIRCTYDSGTTNTDNSDEVLVRVASSRDIYNSSTWSVTESIDLWIKMNFSATMGLFNVSLPPNWYAKTIYLYIFEKCYSYDFNFTKDNLSLGTQILYDIPEYYYDIPVVWNASFDISLLTTTGTISLGPINVDDPSIPGIDSVLYLYGSKRIAQEFNLSITPPAIFNLTFTLYLGKKGTPPQLNVALFRYVAGFPYGTKIAEVSLTVDSDSIKEYNVTFVNPPISSGKYFLVVSTSGGDYENSIIVGMSLARNRSRALFFDGYSWSSYYDAGLLSSIYMEYNVSLSDLDLTILGWKITEPSVYVRSFDRVFANKISFSTDSRYNVNATINVTTTLMCLVGNASWGKIKVNEVTMDSIENNAYRAVLSDVAINQSGNYLYFDVMLFNQSDNKLLTNGTFHFLMAVDLEYKSNMTYLLKNDTIVGFSVLYNGTAKVQIVPNFGALEVSLNSSTARVYKVYLNNTLLEKDRDFRVEENKFGVSRSALRTAGVYFFDNSTIFWINVTLAPSFRKIVSEKAFINESFMVRVENLTYISNISDVYIIVFSPSGQIIADTNMSILEGTTRNFVSDTLEEMGEYSIEVIALMPSGENYTLFEDSVTCYALRGYVSIPEDIYAYEEATITVIAYYLPYNSEILPGSWDHANVTVIIDGSTYNATLMSPGTFEYTYSFSPGTHTVAAIIRTDHGEYTTPTITFNVKEKAQPGQDYTMYYYILAVVISIVVVAGVVYHIYQRRKRRAKPAE